jgi:hypothetical protein
MAEFVLETVEVGFGLFELSGDEELFEEENLPWVGGEVEVGLFFEG